MKARFGIALALMLAPTTTLGFICGDGTGIQDDYVCDGINDCDDFSDEDEFCGWAEEGGSEEGGVEKGPPRSSCAMMESL